MTLVTLNMFDMSLLLKSLQPSYSVSYRCILDLLELWYEAKCSLCVKGKCEVTESQLPRSVHHKIQPDQVGLVISLVIHHSVGSRFKTYLIITNLSCFNKSMFTILFHKKILIKNCHTLISIFFHPFVHFSASTS